MDCYRDRSTAMDSSSEHSLSSQGKEADHIDPGERGK